MEITFIKDQLAQVAAQVIAHSTHKIILFDAPMGAGKTTLINEISKQLGVIDATSSPTFSIANEYFATKLDESIYHFDLYRLEDEEEAYDMGMDEYLDSGRYCFIEWPEKAPHIIPDDHTIIQIEILDQEKRKLTLSNM